MKRHKESDMQIRLVKWFRVTYPELCFLLEHPHNEGNGLTRSQQIIANREGVTKGVADLIFHVPSRRHHSLALELKWGKNTQSKEQKYFQMFFEAAGGKYVVIRSYDQGVEEVTKYLADVSPNVITRICQVYNQIEKEKQNEALGQLEKLLNSN